MKWSTVKEWPRDHKLMLAGLVVACLALVAAWLCVPGMPKLFNWDHVAKSESTQGAPSASSSGRNAAPRPVEQPTQPSAVVIKGSSPKSVISVRLAAAAERSSDRWLQ